MKILVTGSTSQHLSELSHSRSSNFFGLLSAYLKKTWPTAKVDWLAPSVGWTKNELSEYDVVLVGLAPPQALGANKMYGAFSVISHLWGSDRLRLVVDQPDVDVLTRGLRSMSTNWGSFTKPFFSYRKEYEEVVESKELRTHLKGAFEALLDDDWPPVIVPAYPWFSAESMELGLPKGAAGRLIGTNFDLEILDRFSDSGEGERAEVWTFEKHADYKWMQSLNLGFPTEVLPLNHRIETDTKAASMLGSSVGFLASPVGDRSWWTPKLAMALAKKTPVFPPWQETAWLGSSWSILPSTFETLDSGSRTKVAQEQVESYIDSLPSLTLFDKSIDKTIKD